MKIILREVPKPCRQLSSVRNSDRHMQNLACVMIFLHPVRGLVLALWSPVAGPPNSFWGVVRRFGGFELEPSLNNGTFLFVILQGLEEESIAFFRTQNVRPNPPSPRKRRSGGCFFGSSHFDSFSGTRRVGLVAPQLLCHFTIRIACAGCAP